MPRLKSFIVYLATLLLISLFSIIVITENTTLVSDLYKDKIIKAIESKSSLDFTVNNLEVKWHGLNTNLIFHDISFYKKNKKNIYIKGESIVLNINILQSLLNSKLKLLELKLVNSDVVLLYNKKGLFIKDYNLLDTNNFTNKEYSDISLSNIKFRISNSNISIKNEILDKSHELNNTNLVLFKKENDLQIFTTFNNNTNNEIIHLASKFYLDNENNYLERKFSKCKS